MSKNKTFNIICWICVVVFLLITVFPFFWILISSFSRNRKFSEPTAIVL